jgi:phosphotriesterase-related protein
VDRREFLLATSAVATTPALTSRQPWVMTVRGPVRTDRMGVTLAHEHLLADLRPQEEKARRPRPYDPDDVLEVVLPHLRRIHDLGCRTFVDCTAVYLGRDAALLRRIAKESDFHILAATGNYAALQLRALPAHVLTDSVDRLARRWIGEWRDGIEGTRVRPGLMKLGVDGGPLTEVEQKLIRAGAIAHLETGLPIATHISGPSDFLQGQGIRHWSATAALQALEIVEGGGVQPSAFIWYHAQNEPDLGHHIDVARRGAWLSYDGVSSGPGIARYVDLVMHLRSAGLLHRVLVSQDAGWYRVGEPGGGAFRGYEAVFTELIPQLRARGVSEDEVAQIFVRNPANAFSIGVRAG